MTDMKKASINIDASEAVNQLKELIEALYLELKTLERISECVLNLLLSRGSSLFDYVVFSDPTPTLRTTDVDEVTIKVKIVGSTDELAAAIRAGNLDGLTSHNN